MLLNTDQNFLQVVEEVVLKLGQRNQILERVLRRRQNVLPLKPSQNFDALATSQDSGQCTEIFTSPRSSIFIVKGIRWWLSKKVD